MLKKRQPFVYLLLVLSLIALQPNDCSAWQIETIASAGDVGKYSSLAVDPLNKIHIAYFDETSSGVKYVTNVSGSWQTETVDTVYVGEHNSISLTLDSADKVHISYLDGSNEDLKYATNKSGMWQTEIVDSLDRAGYWNSIAVDSLGNVHISYFETMHNDFKYATKVGGTWHLETIESGNAGRYSSIDSGYSKEASRASDGIWNT